MVGGAYADSNFAGLWFSNAVNGSVNFDNRVGSRLIRHQTSTGREVQETTTK